MRNYLLTMALLFCTCTNAMEVKKDIHSVPVWNDIFTVQGYFYEKEFKLVIDTGTSYSVVGKDLIDEIKSLYPNLKIKKKYSKFLKQDILYSDKVKFYLDENYIYPSRLGFSDLIKNLPFETDGILGFEYLYNIGFKINFQDGALTLNPKELYGNKVRLKVKDYNPTIEVIINGCKFLMKIDTGANSSSLKEKDWNRLMQCGSAEIYKEEIYTSNAFQSMHEAIIEKGVFEMKIGDSISNITLYKAHGALSNSSLLGNDILKDYEMTIPKKSKYVYLYKMEKSE
ncbi:hypothetical protein CJA_1520 [Cellvibrio japonicus Ueda107]|uniref:Aspartyl protease n=2 Tax=Cellvibrio japonicus TaxID=155077 RepID=B3PDR0_CELJU|nr:retroviral-like aspartic protease family protein [Cellvibrio japonicus]ACE86284.1 hypothetical protein CJA_1520 [Cellvibrio japonicus Ueda107]QEI12065.1 hypothetical protein FY117_07390 [Cellvibrio japonicus]QEI15639.1 hypothetical protein FY116_07395 [Cellvibrio japonicus]QEI19217.1 hypothetical protein FY115_07390 [Cellvibrio japonicus]